MCECEYECVSGTGVPDTGAAGRCPGFEETDRARLTDGEGEERGEVEVLGVR